MKAYIKKFRIVKISNFKRGLNYRVDQRHWILFIPYWDNGASSMMPNYLFRTKADAERAILKKVLIYKEDLI